MRILVVCTANVCRSPAAEVLLRHHLRGLSLHRAVAVSSAGTDVAAPGRRPDPRVVDVITEFGVRMPKVRAAPLSARLLDAADLVLAMEHSHLDLIADRFPDVSAKTALFDLDDHDVPDPYFGSKSDVRLMVEHVDRQAAQRAHMLTRHLSP